MSRLLAQTADKFSLSVSNARVEPMKHHTRPKFEVQTAAIATQLKQNLIEHDFNLNEIFD